MMNALAWIVLSAATFSAPIPASAQQPAATLRVTARLVEVPVTVLDSRGHYVDGLERGDFQIIENGQPQKIKYFEDNAGIISCAILLDTTGSMEKALPRLKNSVIRFIDELGADDSVAIYSFSEALVQQQKLTKDKAAAKRSVLRLRAGGNTALFDALTDVTGEIARESGKKVVVVFTDGDDNASVLTAQAAVRRATKDGVPLFSIAEGEATESVRLKKILTDISSNTGGEMYEIRSIKDIEEIFSKISTALQHIYLITYQPPLEPDDGKWRRIEVLIGDANKYRIRAKEGYFPK
jgi:Ca-activated chloride channel family protein